MPDMKPIGDIQKVTDKKIDISETFRNIREFYRTSQGQKVDLLVELAKKLGVKIPYTDNRDMFLVANEQGKLIGTAVGVNETMRIKKAHPEYQVYNRTHPRCPPELREEFDRLTGW